MMGGHLFARRVCCICIGKGAVDGKKARINGADFVTHCIAGGLGGGYTPSEKEGERYRNTCGSVTKPDRELPTHSASL